MIAKIMDKVYSSLALVTMALGVAVAIMFVFALILSGETGQSIAILAGKIMNWGIQLAAVATFAGIMVIYIRKEHSLTIDVEKNEEPMQEHDVSTIERTAL
ncbi:MULTISPECIES: hypothetical protein [Cytobacillus]|uniref:hypothetical protein n=1 Tax=Cytobacillus TaxID=2675230 RepID=UPI00203ACB1C|nr:hypothetical protein [Cytobacillus firmus]MCM3706389.1 hypothetical protein [Cytobacillus firmus]